MPSANIVINQTGVPAGVAGKSRSDLALGTPVTVTNNDDTGVRAHRWTLIAPESSSATLTTTISASTSFTPDVAGSYKIILEVNDGRGANRQARIGAVLDVNGFRIPALTEGGEFNEGGNEFGWGPALEAVIRSFVGVIPVFSDPDIILTEPGQIRQEDSTATERELIHLATDNQVKVGDANVQEVLIEALSDTRFELGGVERLHLGIASLSPGSPGGLRLGDATNPWSQVDSRLLDARYNAPTYGQVRLEDSGGNMRSAARLLSDANMLIGSGSVTTTQFLAQTNFNFSVTGVVRWYMGTSALRPFSAFGSDLGTDSIPVGTVHSRDVDLNYDSGGATYGALNVHTSAGAARRIAQLGTDTRLVFGEDNIGINIRSGLNLDVYLGNPQVFEWRFDAGGTGRLIPQNDNDIGTNSLRAGTIYGATFDGTDGTFTSEVNADVLRWGGPSGPRLRLNTGDPNGSVTGNPGELILDSVDDILFFKRDGTGNSDWRDISSQRQWNHSLIGVAGDLSERFFNWYTSADRNNATDDQAILTAPRSGRITALKVYATTTGGSSITATVIVYINGVAQHTETGINLSDGDWDVIDLTGSPVAFDVSGASHDEIAVSMDRTSGATDPLNYGCILEWEIDAETSLGA